MTDTQEELAGPWSSGSCGEGEEVNSETDWTGQAESLSRRHLAPLQLRYSNEDLGRKST